MTARERKKGQLHKVFKDSFDAKAIFSHQFLFQKIIYIHSNPIGGKWMLVKEFIEYEPTARVRGTPSINIAINGLLNHFSNVIQKDTLRVA